MTSDRTPTESELKILEFLKIKDRYLYEFLEAGIFHNYSEASNKLNDLAKAGWIQTSWDRDEGCSSMVRSLTESGRALVSKVESIAKPERSSFFPLFGKSKNP